MFFDKELYDSEDIDKWIEEIKILKINFLVFEQAFS